VQLNHVIPEYLDLIGTAFKRKEIKINLDFDPDLPTIAVEEKQIQQVFINLLKNAADSISGKGEITIKTYVEQDERSYKGKYVTTSISDTGHGIPPEDLNKIFQPFFTRKADGTGLGLPITQRIIHQHSGIIDIDTAVGKGSTFYIKLPIPCN
jgi:two-component system NtrC family sensor kinase